MASRARRKSGKAVVKRSTPRKPPQKVKIRKMSKLAIAEALAAQAVRHHKQRLTKTANKAVAKFRPKKTDKGEFVMVGTDGKRDPQKRGKRGYLVYVKKTGKKELLPAEDLRSQKLTSIKIPLQKKFAKARKNFTLARKVKVGSGRPRVVRRDKTKAGGAYDFSEKIVNKLSRSIQKALQGQASHRVFIINCNVLVRLPDGRRKVYNVEVPIERPDHITIKLGGIINFVRKKFYAFMARELAYDGYVSSGSANHIRRLGENQGSDMEDWVDDTGESWRGNESEIVHIETFEWTIEQAR